MLNPLYDIDESDLNRNHNKLVNERTRFTIVDPQYLPTNGDVTRPPFLKSNSFFL